MRFLQHHGKIGIRKPEAERIADTVRREGFKIAVAYVNIFLVNVFKLSAVIGCGRVIRQAVTNGIRQLSAGGNSARNHIGCCIPALLSAVPYIKNGCDRIFTGFLQKLMSMTQVTFRMTAVFLKCLVTMASSSFSAASRR